MEGYATADAPRSACDYGYSIFKRKRRRHLVGSGDGACSHDELENSGKLATNEIGSFDIKIGDEQLYICFTPTSFNGIT